MFGTREEGKSKEQLANLESTIIYDHYMVCVCGVCARVCVHVRVCVCSVHLHVRILPQ